MNSGVVIAAKGAVNDLVNNFKSFSENVFTSTVWNGEGAKNMSKLVNEVTKDTNGITSKLDKLSDVLVLIDQYEGVCSELSDYFHLQSQAYTNYSYAKDINSQNTYLKIISDNARKIGDAKRRKDELRNTIISKCGGA